MPYDKYTTAIRQEWVKDNLPRIEAEGLSTRQIALEIRRQFNLDRPPSPATPPHPSTSTLWLVARAMQST